MSRRPFPPHAVRAIERLARGIAGERHPGRAPVTGEEDGGSGAGRFDRAGSQRALVLGSPDLRTLAALERALGTLTVIGEPDLSSTSAAQPNPHAAPPATWSGAPDVVIALDWLHRLRDPVEGAEWLRMSGAGQFLLAVPREPLAALGIPLTARLLPGLVGAPGHTLWSGPGLLRFTSRIGGMRDMAAPYPWTVLWVRRN